MLIFFAHLSGGKVGIGKEINLAGAGLVIIDGGDVLRIKR